MSRPAGSLSALTTRYAGAVPWLVGGLLLVLGLFFLWANGLFNGDRVIGNSSHPGFQGEFLFQTHFEYNWDHDNSWRHFDTGYMNWPDGEALHFAVANSWHLYLTLPLRKLFGPVAGYNVTVLLVVLLNLLAAYALTSALFASRVTAFFAALVVGGGAYMWLKVDMGFVQKFTYLWLPLYLRALIQLYDTRQWRHLLYAALLLTAMQFTYPPYGFYMAFATALLAIGVAIGTREVRFAATRLGLVGLVVLVVTLALYASMGLGLVYGQMASPEFVPVLDGCFNLFSPFHFQPYVSPYYPGGAFVGLSVVASALAAVSLLYVRGLARLAAMLVLAFVLLAAGPFLQVHGQPVLVAGHQVPLPWYFLARFLPFFGGIYFPVRLFPIINLFLGVAAGFGLQWLTARLPTRAQNPTRWLALLLVLVEVPLLFPGLVPPRTSAVAPPALLADVTPAQTQALLFLPETTNRKLVNRYGYQAALVGVPMVNPYQADTVRSRIPLPTAPTPEKDAFAAWLRRTGIHRLVMQVRLPDGLDIATKKPADYDWLRKRADRVMEDPAQGLELWLFD